MPPRESTATLLAVLIVVGTVASVTALGIVTTPVVADQHTYEDATDYTDQTDYTVNLPYKTDHYPGDQNEENGSIQYFYVGEDAMREMGAEEGAYIDYIIINADWIDYSACEVDNTESFGIDRGNDNEGTETDEDLVQRHKEATFRDDGITVEFYDWDDLGGDPPYLAPEDAIVASQGEGSAGGPCLTMTEEPGWYQVEGFMNGTEADNGEGEQPSEDAEQAGGIAYSNYVYVCECDSEEEAREELGPPPNEDGGEGGESTPAGDEGDGDAGGEDDEATPTADGGDGEGDGDAGDGAAGDGAAGDGDDGADGDPEATPTADDAGDGSAGTQETAAGDEDAGTPGATDGQGQDHNQDQDRDQGDAQDDTDQGGPDAADDQTPTADDGPGFGAVAALLALLSGALVARRLA